jgi:hypothetical protein
MQQSEEVTAVTLLLLLCQKTIAIGTPDQKQDQRI